MLWPTTARPAAPVIDRTAGTSGHPAVQASGGTAGSADPAADGVRLQPALSRLVISPASAPPWPPRSPGRGRHRPLVGQQRGDAFLCGEQPVNRLPPFRPFFVKTPPQILDGLPLFRD